MIQLRDGGVAAGVAGSGLTLSSRSRIEAQR